MEEIKKKTDPKPESEELEKMAADEFNKAASKFFLGTIELARRLSPKAQWGFYGFPMCNYDAGNDGRTVCHENYTTPATGHNDKLKFITDSGTAIFPSIYVRDTSDANVLYIQAILKEARRVAENKPIIPYTKFEYDPFKIPPDFYNEQDLCNSIKQSADYGSAGVILWSTSTNITQRCTGIADFVRDKLGPEVVTVVQKQATECASKRCSEHGSCVLMQDNINCAFNMHPDSGTYRCQCDKDWAGDSCDKPAEANSILDEANS